ncbi:hypothetical protein [Acetomicrobium thermoterrenum]|uniref:hypothetical protein n=1 Tax=Acetomicrobium thermoterrenum TaxID=1120986 RepID=UPI0013563D04|nr:hypothetical protein [Acetomicrobium thermoterrenum]
MSSLLRCRCNWVNLFPWVWLVAVPPPPWMVRSGYYRGFLLRVLFSLLCGILQGVLPVIGSTAKRALCLSGYVARKALASSMVVMPASRMTTTSRC